MDALTFRQSPATLQELNARLEACQTEKSKQPLDLDVPEEQLATLDICMAGPVIQRCLEAYQDVSREKLSLLQRHIIAVFPITRETAAAHRVFATAIENAFSLEKAMQQCQATTREDPAARLAHAMDVEPKPTTAIERAEKFQTILSWMLCEGRLLRLVAMTAEIAKRIERLQPKIDKPPVYPQRAQNEKEFAFWIQLATLLEKIRDVKTTDQELTGIFQRLERHGSYKKVAMQLLEFHVSLRQLQRREQTTVSFLERGLADSLLMQTLGRWKKVQEIVAPFGAFLMELRQKQKKKLKPGQMILTDYLEQEKVFAAFMKARPQQKQLFEHTTEQFARFTLQNRRLGKWELLKCDAGPQEVDEELPFGKAYRTYDPTPAPSATQLLQSISSEVKVAAVEPALGKKFPFSYALDCHRGLSLQADRFYDCGLTLPFPECTLYLLPAQVEQQRGTLTYAVKDGICFYRAFHPQPDTFLFQKFSQSSFAIEDFPEIAQLVQQLPALAGIPSPEERHEPAIVNPDTGSVTLSSLTLFLLR